MQLASNDFLHQTLHFVSSFPDSENKRDNNQVLYTDRKFVNRSEIFIQEDSGFVELLHLFAGQQCSVTKWIYSTIKQQLQWYDASNILKDRKATYCPLGPKFIP